MKLPRFRPRFALRWLMIVVAVAAVVLSLAARRASLLKRRDHWERFIGAHVFSVGSSGPRYLNIEDVNKARTLVKKYEQAARYPWLLVDPDPAIPHSDFLGSDYDSETVLIGPDKNGEYHISRRRHE